MTIKQHGGIFGRNPTFNEIGGTLKTAAQPNVTSLGTQTSNLAFASGNGIDFSATGDAAGSTSELFDEYEEGTFTATLRGSTGEPVTLVTTTGYYTRVGNLANFSLRFAGSNTTSYSGNITITGLPFTVGQDATAASAIYRGATFSTFTITTLSSTTISFNNPVSNGNFLATQHFATTAVSIWVSGSYRI